MVLVCIVFVDFFVLISFVLVLQKFHNFNMFGRARCREWTPLATQQLRLRSLLQIVGYNIRPPECCSAECSFYFTLHPTTMSAPFYTSERIASLHPKWREIDSEITQRMSSTNIVIRIWCHSLQSPTSSTSEEKPDTRDSIIQTWGVYFSGLRYIGANLALNFTSDCFKSNTLVFQMHGGYFCSYKSLKLDIIPPENEIEHGSLSSDSSGRTNKAVDNKLLKNHKILKESRSLSPSKFTKKLSEREYSKSHSPVEREMRYVPSMRVSPSLQIRNKNKHKKEDPGDRKYGSNEIYEHSPDSLDVEEFATTERCDMSKNSSKENIFDSKIDISETAENYDIRSEADGVPKYRYFALNFLKSELRQSYNSSKLQKLHILQYSIKKKQDAVQEIKERIYKKSALTSMDDSLNTISENKMKFKSRSQRSLFNFEENDELNKKLPSAIKNGRVKLEDKPMVSNGPRLTLKLNDLLSFKSKPSPYQRAEHVRLTKQLEILRFKRIILSDERNSKLANIRRLKEIYAKLCEENQDVGTELMQKYHALSRCNDALKESRQSSAALRDLAARSHAALAGRRTALLADLAAIFYIEQKDASTWKICDVPLPVCGDENPQTSSALSDSIAAGLAAQATCIAAALMGQPLRYQITLLGSASRILDVSTDLTDPNVPLYCGSGDIMLFRYGMFLLNKCVAQLLHRRGVPVPDLRPTLLNLKRLMLAPNAVSDTSRLFGTYKWLADSQCPRTQSLRSLVASERGKYGRQFNRFKDAVDGQSPESVMSLQRRKHSRSVGSCQDDDLPRLDASTTSIMGSEPNIYHTKLPKVTSVELTEHALKAHNSDSELAHIKESPKVLFGLGDDTTLENIIESPKVLFALGDDTTIENLHTEKLVRLSTNNEDETYTCQEDVRQICTEITDYCDVKSETNEAFDVAKHKEQIKSELAITEGVKDIEDALSCDNCDSNVNGDCDLKCVKTVRDVVIIDGGHLVGNNTGSDGVSDCEVKEGIES